MLILEVDPGQAPHLARPQADPAESVGGLRREASRSAPIVEGEVKNKTEFGLFIGLENDVDGMVHLSDLDWNRPGEQVIDEFKKGDVVRAQVLDVDVEKERISLGIKQLAGDPFADAGEIKKGQVVTCEVLEVKDSGLEVKIVDTDLADLHPPRRARPRPRRPAAGALRRRREGRCPRDAVRPQGAPRHRCRSRRSRSPRRRRRSPSTARPIPAPRSATSSAPRSTRPRRPTRSDEAAKRLHQPGRDLSRDPGSILRRPKPARHPRAGFLLAASDLCACDAFGAGSRVQPSSRPGPGEGKLLMSYDAEMIADRRRLRRKLSFWRVFGVLALIAAVVVVGLAVAWRGPVGGVQQQIARISRSTASSPAASAWPTSSSASARRARSRAS